MKNTKKTLISYAVTTSIGLLAAYAIMSMQGLFTEPDVAVRYRILADAFSVPGVILMCFAGLVWVSSDGFFDALGYTAARVGGMFIPAYRAKHENYLTYKQRKNKERSEKESGSIGFLLFVGLGFFIIAIVFFVLYHLVYVPKV